MGLLSSFWKLYNLDTLDTRFTTQSSVPYKTVIDSRDDPAAASKDRAAKWNGRTTRSRWHTPEFYLYYLIVYPAIPYMLWIIYTASTSRCLPTYHDPRGNRGEYTGVDVVFQALILVIRNMNISSPRDGFRDARS